MMRRGEICYFEISEERIHEHAYTLTMNGAKIAFKMPMKMKRLLSLADRHVNYDGDMVFANYAPVNQRRSILALQEHLSSLPSPLLSNRYSIKQNWRFHSRARVSVRPLPSSVGHPCGSGTLKSSSSLLKSAMRKFSCRMIRFAMSCARLVLAPLASRAGVRTTRRVRSVD